ncbi:hypothetical protein DFO70_12710 [Cytobacillus firmus]|uniref:Uncharacterized protein n=2 Tax=Cytobacillus TaxID=2675230 RepID=A0A366JIE4_CYTFI|nr:hypothetical protein DFO70_12710 [Cytobacillus firmus]TDX35915.1 hypothetical protein DFO72_1245 [Cytobacillus oceanisediminis]
MIIFSMFILICIIMTVIEIRPLKKNDKKKYLVVNGSILIISFIIFLIHEIHNFSITNLMISIFKPFADTIFS